MITHIVLLQPESETTMDELTQAFEHIQKLKQSIPGIIDIYTGENLSANHHGYTYGFVIYFTDSDSFKNYAPHPAHQIVSDELVRICSSIIDFDLTSSSTKV